MPHRFIALATTLVLLASGLQAEEALEKTKPIFLSLDAGNSSAVYTVAHALHTVVATSNKVEGTLAFLPDGGMQVMVRAPVNSFDSQNANRDAHMQEVMEATTHPYVVFKGASPTLAVPTSFPATLKLDLRGELDFHGRKRVETVPVELTFTSPSEVRALARFDVSLTRYEVPRPSLMFLTVDDLCTVAVDLLLKGK